MKIVVFLVAGLIAFCLSEETGTEATGDESPTEVDTKVDTEKPEEEKTYFTEEWTKLYSAKSLENQPKWWLADTQPESGAYQTRVYNRTWWISSFVPCRSQLDTQKYGYMSLYIYFFGNNYQERKYPFTYPVVMKVDHGKPEKKSARTDKKRKGKKGENKYCSKKYTEMFYLPIKTTKFPASIYHRSRDELKTALVEQETYYVREYSGNSTMAYCNQQAFELGSDLIKDNIWFNENVWYCAGYEPPIGSTEQKQEVWIKVKKY